MYTCTPQTEVVKGGRSSLLCRILFPSLVGWFDSLDRVVGMFAFHTYLQATGPPK